MRRAHLSVLVAILLFAAGCAGTAQQPTAGEPTRAAPSVEVSSPEETAPEETVGEEPTPEATENGGEAEADLVGTLEGDATLEGGCAWLEAADGTRWQVIWPPGYHLMFEPERGPPLLMGPDGTTVAHAGDRVAVTGQEATDMLGFCQVGPFFEAEEVLED
jgi:hypothetical protein